MKKTRTLGALGAVMTLSLALAACSGGDGGSSDEETGASGEGDNTLTVWAWDPAFNIYALEEAEKVYQADHPDFELEIVETPWEDVQTKLTTLAQSGETDQLPDIFLMQNNAFQKNVINYPDIFADFTDSAVDFSQFPESVVAYSTYEDVNYGVPFDNGTAIGAYRTDILEAAGYTVDDFTDITWDEFLTIGKDVLAKTGKPMLTGQAGSADTIMMMLQSAGASLFDDEGKPTITDNDALLAAIDMYGQMVDAGVFVEVNSLGRVHQHDRQLEHGRDRQRRVDLRLHPVRRGPVRQVGRHQRPEARRRRRRDQLHRERRLVVGDHPERQRSARQRLPERDVRRLDRVLRHDPPGLRRARQLAPGG